jgi:hypothetical protein
MAKAKKEKSPAPAEEKSAPKLAARAKKTPKPAAPSAPLIDTSLAAKAAAKLVANRELLSQASEKRPGGSFKLKEQLLKPATQGPGGILQPTEGQKRFNPILGGRNQVGHNQTFGADVNRTGVPRRTGG